MIEVERQQPERVLLVGVATDDYDDAKFNLLMKELSDLTLAAGGNPVKTVTQKLARVDSRTLVGSGKLLEIEEIVNKEAIELVITLNDLSNNMNRNLEDQLHVRVIDRVQLILDIFALRAKSKEGKLQVQIAQYEYFLPRLSGQGKHLSRLGGGIGTRGPGETKLESDRRHIRSQMNHARKELANLEKHRERNRAKRQSGREYNIGLVGYTNAGKSTLLRELTASETYVQDQLFATLDPLTRRFSINGHDAFTLTDTVGFIEDLPVQLIDAFRSTLEEMRYVDLLLHVVDASSPDYYAHERVVHKLLDDLEMKNIPMITVYNKKDLVDDQFIPHNQPHILISALDHNDLESLKSLIWDILMEASEPFSVDVQQDEADLLALYRQKTLIQEIIFDEEKQTYRIKGFRRRLNDI
ncbi:GTPase HflX [Fundicoccus culcitae]|uniref:GTPase HflX n=1 Tax=Fundicoccus culcitae TaxID=2969821 RepID=A0ABY5P774_9LACT|nr:GTPase HflX [Fundicoccus culcitae]UUX34258.1 GTPase HflX [Fundicoccus culcitae]